MVASKKKVEAKKIGRPTKFTQELADLICERVASSSHGLQKLCDLHEDLPPKQTVNIWRHKHPGFRAQYAQAKCEQADLLAEECLDIADDDSLDTKINPLTGEEVCNTEFIARSRLRIDTRKWMAAKLLPKQYGRAAEEPEKTKSDGESILEKILDKLTE